MQEKPSLDPTSGSASRGEEPDERRLLALIAAGRGAALDEVYRRYYRRLGDFLARLVPAELVDEVVNDTLYVVWRKAGEFRAESKVSTWIFGIAYRKAMKQRRREKRYIEAARLDDLPPLEVGDASAMMAGLQRRQLLEQALERLPPAQRSVVTLTWQHGCSYQEIADILDCPVNTVKTRMFHARAVLKRILDRSLPEADERYDE